MRTDFLPLSIVNRPCDSCGKMINKNDKYFNFKSLAGTPRSYCQKCTESRIKWYKCQECGKQWMVLKNEGWYDDPFVDKIFMNGKWVEPFDNDMRNVRTFKVKDNGKEIWVCILCLNKLIEKNRKMYEKREEKEQEVIDSNFRSNPEFFERFCAKNKPQNNYRFRKLVSETKCKYNLLCDSAIKYGYCKSKCQLPCEICNKKMYIEKCDVHHKRTFVKYFNEIYAYQDKKSYDKEDVEELMILCRSCHRKEECMGKPRSNSNNLFPFIKNLGKLKPKSKF